MNTKQQKLNNVGAGFIPPEGAMSDTIHVGSAASFGGNCAPSVRFFICFAMTVLFLFAAPTFADEGKEIKKEIELLDLHLREMDRKFDSRFFVLESKQKELENKISEMERPPKK